MIRQHGPISVAQFMGESNAHYYAKGDPLGAAGDFITAPDVSQMFGELIGLWLADIWTRGGAPPEPIYCELGPGKGTLANDALRSMARFGLQPRVHLVEASPALRDAQRQSVPSVQFHSDLTSVPEDGPLLLVANEFFDALAVRQLVRTENGWRERMIGLDSEEQFIFVAGDQAMDAVVPDSFHDADDGSIIETSPASAAIMAEVARRLAHQKGAALVIDYGHLEQKTGSTLQAVARHQKVDPLAMPGSADLTAHVDFEALAQAAHRAGVRPLGSTTQGQWLEAMGIGARAASLAQASPDHADTMAKAHRRLVHPEEMGTLFKVMGLAHQTWPDGAGFDV